MKHEQAKQVSGAIYMPYTPYDAVDGEQSYMPFPVAWSNGERADADTVVLWGKYAVVAYDNGLFPLPLARGLFPIDAYRGLVRNWVKLGGTLQELINIEDK